MPLAQVNIARPVAGRDAGLATLAGPVDASAEAADGFLWRLPAAAPHRLPDGRVVVNLSLWRDLESLRTWAYGDAAHVAAMRRRREWFTGTETALALWWVPGEERPTIADARARLAHLDRHGPTPFAFTFRRPFAPAT